MITLDQALDTVMEPEQQEMLIEIMRKRHIERCRKEIAEDAEGALHLVRLGQLKPRPIEEIIAELRQALAEDAE